MQPPAVKESPREGNPDPAPGPGQGAQLGQVHLWEPAGMSLEKCKAGVREINVIFKQVRVSLNIGLKML